MYKLGIMTLDENEIKMKINYIYSRLKDELQYRKVGFFSSRLNWDPPPPHSLAGEGCPNSDKGAKCGTPVYMYFVVDTRRSINRR